MPYSFQRSEEYEGVLSLGVNLFITCRGHCPLDAKRLNMLIIRRVTILTSTISSFPRRGFVVELHALCAAIAESVVATERHVHVTE